MQALVLVGGKGTRLRPLTEETPKPILTLVDRPFLSYMVEWLGSLGVDQVVLACGFLPDRLKEVLGDGGPPGPEIRYLVEPEPRGTGGAIRFALPELEDRFLALNGDILTDLDLSALWRSHEERGARASLGLYPVEDPTGYGLVELSRDGSVLEFLEKPEPGHSGPGLINAGAYVLERSVFEGVPDGVEVSIESDVFPRLAGSGLYGLELDGYWMDIGTPERYLEASWDIIEGRVGTPVEVNREGVHVDSGATVDAEARIGPRAVIASGCRVGARATVSGSVLLEGCEVGEDAVVEGSILAPGAKIPAGSNLEGRVLGKNEVAGD